MLTIKNSLILVCIFSICGCTNAVPVTTFNMSNAVRNPPARISNGANTMTDNANYILKYRLGAAISSSTMTSGAYKIRPGGAQ